MEGKAKNQSPGTADGLKYFAHYYIEQFHLCTQVSTEMCMEVSQTQLFVLTYQLPAGNVLVLQIQSWVCSGQLLKQVKCCSWLHLQ